MENEKAQLSVEVARLYYQLEYSQQQIANQLNISRPTVSRLLKFAKEQGFVTITITDPFSSGEAIEEQLKEKYNLKEVVVAKTPSENYELIVDQLSTQAVHYLEKVVKQGDIIGVGWGTTIYHIAKKLTPQATKNIQVIQLKGSITHAKMNTYAHETLALFADNYQTTGLPLPLPVIFDHAKVKKIVESDRHIQRLMSLGEKSNIAIFTVGTVRDEALLFQLGYLNQSEKKKLQEKAVGDICSRFYDIEGNIADKTINDRTIGIELKQLAKKERSVLIAGGKHKLLAIKGALTGKYANVLITDYWTAQALLE